MKKIPTTKKEKRIFCIQWSLKACVAVAITVLVCFAIFPKGFGWFASDAGVRADGMSVTMEKPESMNFDAAYNGSFEFTDQINFGIENSLLLYPQNYITVVFSLAEETDFYIAALERRLTDEEFIERFQDRRDLLLGDYTTGTPAVRFDVENIFPRAEYADGDYVREIDGLPARPTLSILEEAAPAYKSAYADYLEASMPYLMDLLHRFSEDNSMYDAITFSLFVQEGGSATEYLLLPRAEPLDDGSKKYVPAYYRAVGTEAWSKCTSSVILQPNLSNKSVLYALVLGYAAVCYEDSADGPQEIEPVHPVTTVGAENRALFSDPSVNTPLLGTYYCENYNCFIGSSLAVRILSEEKDD